VSINALQDSTQQLTIYAALAKDLVLNAVVLQLLVHHALQDFYYKTLLVCLLALLVIIRFNKHASFAILFVHNVMEAVLILAHLVLMVTSCNTILVTQQQEFV
jgi:hypothetical protein